MKTINRRASLPHARRALAGGKLTVGFIGGSITESGSFRSYSDQVVNGIASAYPDAKIIFGKPRPSASAATGWSGIFWRRGASWFSLNLR